jgi:DNA-directed RNA polymerase specialized sigma24 family protein
VRGEDKQLLDECLAGLQEDMREVILLRDFAGASWAHIASRLGRPSSDAARKQHERTLIALREAIRGRLGSHPST